MLYNDEQKSYKSRVFVDYGKPFDKSVAIHPVGEDFLMQAESIRKKYTTPVVLWIKYVST